jgi:hypothetical protein
MKAYAEFCLREKAIAALMVDSLNGFLEPPAAAVKSIDSLDRRKRRGGHRPYSATHLKSSGVK